MINDRLRYVQYTTRYHMRAA